LTILRCLTPAPETREAPEDDKLAGNVEENVEVVEDSVATAYEEEEDDDDDVVLFIDNSRRATVDELTGTSESSPSG
jgi:hypothetical protein